MVLILILPYFILNNKNIIIQVKYIIKQVAIASSSHNGGATWFLICLFLTEIICYFILKTKTRTAIIITSIFGIIATIPHIPDFYYNLDVAFMAIPFFICGFYSKEYHIFDKVKDKKNKLYDIILILICLSLPLLNGRPIMYLRDMGNYPIAYYPIVFIYIFTIQRLLSNIKTTPDIIKNISNGTILYIGLQGVGILYWNFLTNNTFSDKAFNKAEITIIYLLSSAIIMIAAYPLVNLLLSNYPSFFGRKRKT